ncbi:MAG: hypothetical protein R3F30_11465 [Planctomycetota bacterium]
MIGAVLPALLLALAPAQDRELSDAQAYLLRQLTEGNGASRVAALEARLARGPAGVGEVAALLDREDWGHTYRLLEVFGWSGAEAGVLADPLRGLLEPELKEPAKRIQVYACLIRLGALGPTARPLMAERDAYRAAVIRSLHGFEGEDGNERGLAALLADCRPLGAPGEDFVLALLARLHWDEPGCRDLVRACLLDPARRVRALPALPGWTGKDPTLVKLLAALLADADCADLATTALRTCSEDAEVLRELLVTTRCAPDPGQSLRAAVLVALRCPSRPLDAEPLGRCLTSGSPALARTALEYLDRNASRTPEVQREVLTLLGSPDDDVRHMAVQVLLRPTPGAEPAVAAVLAFASDRAAAAKVTGPDLVDLYFVLDGAARLGPPAYPILQASLAWRGDGLGARTVAGLKRCGRAALPAIAPLLHRARAEDTDLPGTMVDDLLSSLAPELRVPFLRPALEAWLARRLTDDPNSATNVLLVMPWAVPDHAVALLALAEGAGPLADKALACLAEAPRLPAELRSRLQALVTGADEPRQGHAVLALGRTGFEVEDLKAWTRPFTKLSIPELARLEVLASWLGRVDETWRIAVRAALREPLRRQWPGAQEAVARGLVRLAATDLARWRACFDVEDGLHEPALASLEHVELRPADLAFLLDDTDSVRVVSRALVAMCRLGASEPALLAGIVKAVEKSPAAIEVACILVAKLEGPAADEALARLLQLVTNHKQIRNLLFRYDRPTLHRVDLVEAALATGNGQLVNALLTEPPKAAFHPAEDLARWCKLFTERGPDPDRLAQQQRVGQPDPWVRALAACGHRGVRFLREKGITPIYLQRTLYVNLLGLPMVERSRWLPLYLDNLRVLDHDAMGVLESMVEAPDERRRATALRILIPLVGDGRSMPSHVSLVLRRATEDLSADQRRRAQDWIGTVRPPFEAWADLCRRGLADRDPRVVAAALSTLQAYGAEARALRPEVEALGPLLDDEGRRLRAALLEAWQGP